MTHGGENFEAAAAGQHYVQKQKIEGLRLREIKAVLAGSGHNYLIVFGLEAFLKGFGEFVFVLDDQNTHSFASMYCTRGARPPEEFLKT